MTPAARKTRSQLRKLIGAKDSATVLQGCELMMSLADDAELRPVVDEIALGTSVSEEGQLIIASTSEVKKRCRADFRPTVGLYALASTGALANVQKLGLETCRVPTGIHDVPLETVAMLSGCAALTTLELSDCRAVQNVDALAGCSALTGLNLHGCGALQNVDGLANLTALTTLNLQYCSSLRNVDALADCSELTGALAPRADR